MTIKQINDIKGIVNIARKGGFAIIGQDNLKKYCKKIYLVLFRDDCGESLISIINNLKTKTKYEKIKLKHDEFTTITNIPACKVVAFKNKALSEKIIECIRGENIG